MKSNIDKLELNQLLTRSSLLYIYCHFQFQPTQLWLTLSIIQLQGVDEIKYRKLLVSVW